MPQEMLVGLGFEKPPRTVDQRRPVRGIHGAFRHPGALSRVRGHTRGLARCLATFVPLSCGSSWGPVYRIRSKQQSIGSGARRITAAVVGSNPQSRDLFALHTLFGQVDERHVHGLILQVPSLSTLNVPALLLSLPAMVALFRFKVE